MTRLDALHRQMQYINSSKNDYQSDNIFPGSDEKREPERLARIRNSEVEFNFQTRDIDPRYLVYLVEVEQLLKRHQIVFERCGSTLQKGFKHPAITTKNL